MKTAGSSRALRVSRRIHEEMAELLRAGRLRDPRLRDVWVSSVQVSPDLHVAWIRVRTNAPVSEAEQAQVVTALKGAAAFIRRELGAALRLRYVPDLRFLWDLWVDAEARLQDLLAAEPAPGGADDEREERE
ncbi:MAG: 30S ribosome-binding factor RbfA [Polyangiales bacterium]